MGKFIRYTLATACFAASVGCLALWWRSYSTSDSLYMPNNIPPRHFISFHSLRGMIEAHLYEHSPSCSGGWTRYSPPTERVKSMYDDVQSRVSFGYRNARKSGTTNTNAAMIWFPHWYASLLFALTAVGVLCFHRQFSIRSTLIGLSVVAVLLGMAVAL